jgi:hypothetical protein
MEVLFLFVFLLDLISKSICRFKAKLSRKYREFPYALCFPDLGGLLKEYPDCLNFSSRAGVIHAFRALTILFRNVFVGMSASLLNFSLLTTSPRSPPTRTAQ